MTVKKFEHAVLSMLYFAVFGLGISLQASAASSSNEALIKSLSSPSRPQADRDRDAQRKPAELMSFFGVQPGMTVLDVIAGGGYVTEVLSYAVGPKGKVYMHSPPGMGGRVGDRLANNRLPNVVSVEGNLPNPAIAAGSVDVAITAMNFHDVYNRSPETGLAFMKGVYDALKPGGVFGVIDHAGNEGADNAALHRVTKQHAIETAKAAGFVVEAQSDILANPADDRTKGVRDAEVRGRTDQFTLKLRKPKA